MREVIGDYILNIFDLMIMLVVIHGIHKHLVVKIWQKGAFVFLCALAGVASEMVIESVVIDHITLGLIIFFATWLYLRFFGEKDLSTIILTFMFTIVYVSVFQILYLIVYSFFFSQLVVDFQFSLIAQIISIVAVYLSVRFFPFEHIRLYMVSGNGHFRWITTSAFIVFYGFSIVWFYAQRSMIESLNSLLGMILLGILLNTLIMKNALLNKVYKDKLDVYETYLPVISDMVEELRRNQHDYHNQIQTIRAMKLSDAYTDQEIDDYIEELHDSGIWTKLLRLDNKILAAFLYSKVEEARKLGIPMKIKIGNCQLKTAYTDYELVEIYGVLIDNAIEAVSRQMEAQSATGHAYTTSLQGQNHLADDLDQGHLEHKICLKITGCGYKNHLEVRNTGPYISTKDIQGFFKEGYTTKKGSGGIGLNKVKKMVEREKGDMLFFYDTNQGHVVVQLNHV